MIRCMAEGLSELSDACALAGTKVEWVGTKSSGVGHAKTSG
jgi:hypothetical protein